MWRDHFTDVSKLHALRADPSGPCPYRAAPSRRGRSSREWAVWHGRRGGSILGPAAVSDRGERSQPMKAIRVSEYGGPAVLKLEEIPAPQPGASQVLVRTHAVGINPVDTYIRSHPDNRGPQRPYTPGSDGGGVIEAVGAEVKGFKPGDRVYFGGSVSGAYA